LAPWEREGQSHGQGAGRAGRRKTNWCVPPEAQQPSQLVCWEVRRLGVRARETRKLQVTKESSAAGAGSSQSAST
jgi:hypothetical protein